MGYTRPVAIWTQNEMTKNKAIFEILLCAALWSVAGILMKQIPWSGFVIAGFRSLIAGVVMA